MEVEEKQKCSMLIFSVGAYLETVIPTVDRWMKSVGTLKVNDIEVFVEKVTKGYDDNNKHLQTIIKFKFKKEAVTVTCYNTT